MQVMAAPVTEMLTANVPVNADCKVAIDENDEVYVSSVWIAEYMHYEHKAVMRTIKDKILSTALFENQYDNEIKPAKYNDSYGRPQDCYFLNIAGFFFYCTRTKMSPEQIMQWGQVITGLVNQVKNRYNRTIANLNQQLANQSVADITSLTKLQGEKFLATALEYAHSVLEENKQTIQAQQVQIEQQTQALIQAQPAIEYAKAVSSSQDTCLVRDLAKMISQTLIDNNLGSSFTDKELYAWMRDNGYVSKQSGNSWNKPLKKAIDPGLLRVSENVYQDGNGQKHSSFVTKVTGDGRQFFLEEILKIYRNGGTIKNGIQRSQVRSDVHDCGGPEECVGQDSADAGA